MRLESERHNGSSIYSNCSISGNIYYFLNWGILVVFSIVLVSALQWSDSAICTHISPPFWISQSYLVHHSTLSRVPVLHSKLSLVIYFIQSSGYMSISISQFIPPPFSPLVSMYLLKVKCSICSHQFNIWEHLQEMHLCLRSDIKGIE